MAQTQYNEKTPKHMTLVTERAHGHTRPSQFPAFKTKVNLRSMASHITAQRTQAVGPLRAHTSAPVDTYPGRHPLPSSPGARLVSVHLGNGGLKSSPTPQIISLAFGMKTGTASSSTSDERSSERLDVMSSRAERAVTALSGSVEPAS